MVPGARVCACGMKCLGIIAALPGELRPLVQGWEKVTRPGRLAVAWRGAIGATQCIAVHAGIGREAAQRACRLAEELEDLEGLVSYGWAGAISCGLRGGEAYRVTEVIDAASGQRFAASVDPSEIPLRLVTIDHVAEAQEKRALAEQYQAVLVDMEAAAVAQFAQEREIPFYCLKSVSDTPSDRLPNISQFTNAQGGLRMPGLLAHLALRPRYWGSISRMSKYSKGGAIVAAQALREWVEENADHAVQ